MLLIYYQVWVRIYILIEDQISIFVHFRFFRVYHFNGRQNMPERINHGQEVQPFVGGSCTNALVFLYPNAFPFYC